MTRAARYSDQLVLAPETYAGHLLIDGKQFPIEFVLSADNESRLHFEIGGVDAKTYLAADGTSEWPRQPINRFSLTARSKSGKTIQSGSAFLSGSRSGSGGFSIQISVGAATLTFPLAAPAKAPGLQLWFRSFESFSNPLIETPLGTLAVCGATSVDHADQISGSVAIQAHPERTEPDWYEKADALLF